MKACHPDQVGSMDQLTFQQSHAQACRIVLENATILEKLTFTCRYTCQSFSVQTYLFKPDQKSDRSKGQQWQLLPSSLGTLDVTSRVPFYCGSQQRDNTSALKMLHQMSVWVVVVALRLMPKEMRGPHLWISCSWCNSMKFFQRPCGFEALGCIPTLTKL